MQYLGALSPGCPLLLDKLKQRLIVSCRPLREGPMDTADQVVGLALGAIAGGAAAVHLDSVRDVEAVRARTDVPIIGAVTREVEDSPVRLTPTVEDVLALAEAGADIIAFDATDRRGQPALPTLSRQFMRARSWRWPNVPRPAKRKPRSRRGPTASAPGLRAMPTRTDPGNRTSICLRRCATSRRTSLPRGAFVPPDRRPRRCDGAP